MIIPKIVEALQRLDKSQISAHKKLDAIQINLQKLLGALGSPRTQIIKEKPVDCGVEELRVEMYDKSQVGLESALLERNMSKAIYDAANPRAILPKGEMEKLRYVLENYKALNEITSKSAAQAIKI